MMKPVGVLLRGTNLVAGNRVKQLLFFYRLRNNIHPLFPKNSLVCELHIFSYIFTDLERLVCLFDLLLTPLKSQKIHC